MVVPFKKLSYDVWDTESHKSILNTPSIDDAMRLYNSHANKSNLQVWKVSLTQDGWYEHAKLT